MRLNSRIGWSGGCIGVPVELDRVAHITVIRVCAFYGTDHKQTHRQNVRSTEFCLEHALALIVPELGAWGRPLSERFLEDRLCLKKMVLISPDCVRIVAHTADCCQCEPGYGVGGARPLKRLLSRWVNDAIVDPPVGKAQIVRPWIDFLLVKIGDPHKVGIFGSGLAHL